MSRRFQFSLRDLLGAMILLAACFGGARFGWDMANWPWLHYAVFGLMVLWLCAAAWLTITEVLKWRR
jgi:hypothetical protein